MMRTLRSRLTSWLLHRLQPAPPGTSPIITASDPGLPHITSTGACIASDALCSHGHLPFAVCLHTINPATGRYEHIRALITRCTAARLIGTLLALVHVEGGDQAREDFGDDIGIAIGHATAAFKESAARDDTDD